MIITSHLDKVTPVAAAAWKRCIKADGSLRKTAPNWRQDPEAWAAWQGYRTDFGLHGESDTFKLMMIDATAKSVWEQITELTAICRRAVRAGRVTFQVQA